MYWKNEQSLQRLSINEPLTTVALSLIKLMDPLDFLDKDEKKKHSELVFLEYVTAVRVGEHCL
jgi:hypothetical protein